MVSKLCRTVFAEYESRTTEALIPSLQALDAVRVQAMQYALVGGECLLKPVLHGRGFDFVPIRRDCYAPLGRDAHGALTGVGTMEVLRHDGRGYLLLERRTAGVDGLTIETRLFELAGEALGREVPLAALPATAQLQPSLLLPGVRGVGLAALRTPLLNCVDGGPDAVAVYAPAAGLMHSAARLEYQMRQEFENGASRVFASEDLLREDGYGRRTLQDDLFTLPAACNTRGCHHFLQPFNLYFRHLFMPRLVQTGYSFLMYRFFISSYVRRLFPFKDPIQKFFRQFRQRREGFKAKGHKKLFCRAI